MTNDTMTNDIVSKQSSNTVQTLKKAVSKRGNMPVKSTAKPIGMKPGKVILIEGLIGSGKSTLSEELGKALGPNTLTLLEPDESGGANPYLDDYYKETARYACIMQLHLLGSRFKLHEAAQWHCLAGLGDAILDRGIYFDVSFFHLQYKMGFISERELQTYKMLYSSMVSHILLPTAVLRVLVTPEVALERIAKRMEKREGRKCESTIPLQYLKDLEVEIEKTINELKKSGVHVLDVPWEAERDSAKLRKQTVQGLVGRIKAIQPPDLFSGMHRRTM